MVEPGVRPADRVVTPIGGRRERRPRKGFPDPTRSDEDDALPGEPSDRTERPPARDPRARIVDIHVTGQRLPTRQSDTASARTGALPF